MKIGMIWAEDINGVIGKENNLPWNLPEDLQHFRNITTGHPVIMGHKTWQSLPQKYRPLPNRTNIVLSTKFANLGKPDYPQTSFVANISQALEVAATSPGCAQVWVIGGEQIFSQFLPLAEKIVMTQIKKAFRGDSFAPKFGAEWSLAESNSDKAWHKSSTGLEYRYLVWKQTK